MGRQVIIILIVMYGLKASGGIWYLKLADNLRNTCFRPCQEYFDLCCALGWIIRNILL